MGKIETNWRHLASPDMRLDTLHSIGSQVMDKLQGHLAQNRNTFNFLTDREREVLFLVADGHTDRMVAETLVISPRTVNRHLSNIFTKLNVSGRTAAVAFALRQGLF
jgi:DNA-binding NarL/FixJ family response regulator